MLIFLSSIRVRVYRAILDSSCYTFFLYGCFSSPSQTLKRSFIIISKVLRSIQIVYNDNYSETEMGNCWPKPVDDIPSTNNTKPASPVHFNAQPIKNEIINTSTSSSSPPPADLGGGGRGGGGGDVQTVPPSGQIIGPNLKIFTLAELKSATRNFRPDTVLGEGGFGRVFKGWVDPKTYAPSRVGVGIPVAVKKSNPDSEQGLKEWQAEVKFLGKFSHPNLVKLLGYCWEEKQFLLVYEYVQRGSLESHLFRRGGGEPLSWDARIKIAIGAAKGLAFLHTTEKKVIYRDFKASNILLDGELNAKLSDFGLAKLGPVDGNSHVTTKIVGTYGYAAPEYMATGHLYVKSDVYGFGVVLLEIITGLRVLDLNRPSGQTNLVDWARPSLPNKKKLRQLMDPRLENQYPSKGAYRTAELIIKCLESHLKLRPDMEQVLETLEQISTIQMTPKDLKAQARQEQQHRDGRRQHHHRSPLPTYHGQVGPSGNSSRDLPYNNLHKHRSY